jgi:von Willebrand factor type A domain
MVADGETFIQTGVLWGWRVLSSGGPFADGAATGSKKVMVLMTDGANTMSPTYPAHDGSDVTLANNLTLETCTNAKAAGIDIYAIAFDVTDPTIIDLLGQCASGPPYFYTAATVGDLAAAFDQIGKSLTAIRMAQ